MKWYKHLVDSGDDPDIDDAIALFGSDGYYVFFRTLEIMSREFDVYNPGENVFSISFFKKKFRISWRKTARILTFFDQRGRIFFSYSNGNKIGELTLNCPKLKEQCDEHTRKVLGKMSGVGQESVRKKSHVEPEPELEEDYRLPKGSQAGACKNNHFSNKMQNEIVEKIKTKCNEVDVVCKKQKKDFNPFQWVQMLINKNGHPVAIVDSLDGLIQRMIDTTQPPVKSPWTYVNTIFKTKNGNYYEREYINQNSQHKYIAVNDKIRTLLGSIGK